MRRNSLILATLAVLIVSAGCNRFARQRYETVYVGQPAADVRRALGRPTSQDGDEWLYVHDSPPYYRAVIRISDGKVAGKSWSYDRPRADGDQRPGTRD
jgi:hypothetical protein